MRPVINKIAPDFKAESTQGFIQLSDLKGQNIILYFYPKDSTPGCTIQACGFTAGFSKFQKLNTCILGVSRDSLKSHARFQEKHNIPFPLIADTDENVCKLYDVIQNKNMFGVKVKGIQRSTFLIDKRGNLIKEWRKVKVLGHVKDVLQTLKEIED